MPDISVIIPVYNQASYIVECLQSLQSQNSVDFEILVIDDGSTDQSVKIIKQYMEQDSRIRLLCQANAGVSIARNRGIDEAQGTWICFVDPDDKVDSNYLHTLLEHAGKAQIVMSSCIAFDEHTTQRQYFFPKTFVVQQESEKIPLFHQLIDGGFSQPQDFVTAIGVPWGKLYLRSFINTHHLRFDPELPRMQDNLFNMEAFALASRLVYLDYAGYWYRMGGLSERTYRNTARGLYHAAITKREYMMKKYGLQANKELEQARNIEQVNLYFQEIKAVMMLETRSFAAMRKAGIERARMLFPQLQAINTKNLPKSIAVKYQIMTHKILLTIYAAALYIRR